MNPGHDVLPSRRGKLLERVRETMRVRHLSPRTERAYVYWIRRYVVYHGRRHPAALGETELTDFLSHLALAARVSASTQNQALNALLFLYRDILGRDLRWLADMARAKRPSRLPVVLDMGQRRYVLLGWGIRADQRFPRREVWAGSRRQLPQSDRASVGYHSHSALGRLRLPPRASRQRFGGP